MRERMKGEWEVIYERDQYTQRNVKLIDDEYETMSVYVDDRLVNKWRCRWELDAVGDFAVYRFKDFETLEGSRVFRPSSSGSYLLRVTDNAWYEVVRVEADASGSPRVDAFRRVGSDPRITGTLGVSRRNGPLAPTVTPGRGADDSASAFALRELAGDLELKETLTFVEQSEARSSAKEGPTAQPWEGSEAEWFNMSGGDAAKQKRLEKRALGAWRCEREDGTVIEKLVEPGVEVVRLRRDGETVRIWKTDWQIRVHSGIAQFWFRNYELLEGKRSAPDGIAGGYALSIVGDTWTEVSGMIGQVPNPPTLNIFKRIEDDQAGS